MKTEELALVQGAIAQAYQFLSTQVPTVEVDPKREILTAIRRALTTAHGLIDAEQKAQTGVGKVGAE